ncbi:MAG: hypothetical protein AAFV29_07095 [Myxococcota bacterium]
MGDFKIFLHDHYFGIYDQFDFSGPPKHVVQSACQVLQRKGKITATFFKYLKDEFPDRETEIVQIQAEVVLAPPQGAGSRAVGHSDGTSGDLLGYGAGADDGDRSGDVNGMLWAEAELTLRNLMKARYVEDDTREVMRRASLMFLRSLIEQREPDELRRAVGALRKYFGPE